MSSRLAQRHVLVTGAGGGIGLAIAEACLQQGARCTLVDRSPALSDGVALLQRSHPGHVVYLPGDVTDANAVAQLLESAQAAAGPIHTLVNNAAVFDMAPLLESDEASFDLLFAVNVKALFFVMQRVPQHMVAHGEAGCSVINMASQAGRRGEALVSHYCATKAAVISYTQSAALAMAPQGIRVNAIAPGVVDTPMWAHVDALFARYEGLPPGEKKRRVGLEVPLGRMGTPDEIAGAAVFLASDEARYITAQTLNVDGGNVMS
jgi:D-sorbitol dehydrogenase (acceptor)